MAISKAVPNSLGAKPVEGSRGYQDVADLSAVATVNRAYDLPTIGLSLVQGIFIDNSNSGSPTTFAVPGTQQKITMPAYGQGFAPLMQLGATLQIQVTSAGGVAVPFTLLNTEVFLAIWSVANAGNLQGVITVQGNVSTQPAAVGFTDKSISLTVGGATQQAAAANGARKRLLIINPASAAGQNIANAESCFFNIGAAAGVNDGISVELLPGGSFDTAGGPVPTGAVNVNAATISHRITVKEMQ